MQLFLKRIQTVSLVVLGLFVFSFIATKSSYANVSLKNGNFFMVYVDIIYPGGFQPKIERVYNSKTAYKGVFGWGWGNEYEVFLKVSADASVVVHEYGGGAENRFFPIKFSRKELMDAANNIAKANKQSGNKSYINRLVIDANFRNDEWQKLVSRGVLKPMSLSVGTQLQSNAFSYQYITKTKEGYVRSFDNGKSELFNEQGRLVKVADKNGNYIKFEYGKDGHLNKALDNFNRKMFFTFNARGLVERIDGENGKKVNYKYNKNDELIASQDIENNTYSYKYDARHNMTEIGYPDKTKMVMKYYSKKQYDNVQTVTDRDGTTTEYTYDRDSKDAGHFTVKVAVKDKKNRNISKSSYEYFIKTNAKGVEWTQKMITDLDGDKTETTYNECCGLPIVIKKGKQITKFDYDAKGRVVKKDTPFEITNLKYHDTFGKVVAVDHQSKQNKKMKTWSKFKYDNKGNLIAANNSEKKAVKLFYDGVGRIKSMIDHRKRRIDFEYNENSKPIVIKDPKLGSINVSYTNSGEIKQVNSSAGRKVAVQVVSAFQNLLDIIRPAGVSLSF